VTDTLNAAMAMSNLIALALLSPVVCKLIKEYFEQQKHSERNIRQHCDTECAGAKSCRQTA